MVCLLLGALVACGYGSIFYTYTDTVIYSTVFCDVVNICEKLGARGLRAPNWWWSPHAASAALASGDTRMSLPDIIYVFCVVLSLAFIGVARAVTSRYRIFAIDYNIIIVW